MAYKARRPSQESLRRRLRELAETRVSYGYLRLHVLLRREGWAINHKRTYRLYCEEGLALRRRSPRRRRSAMHRQAPPASTQPNERWAMDFMSDSLADGRAFRVFTLIDVYTRECLALVAQPTFRGHDVAQLLSETVKARGAVPASIQCDQGSEFTSMALDQWAYWNKIRLDFSRRGKPGDNALCEAFNGSFRRECLSQAYFLTLDDVRRTLENWKTDYNNHRPHSGLNQLAPAQFRAGVFTPETVNAFTKQTA